MPRQLDPATAAEIRAEYDKALSAYRKGIPWIFALSTSNRFRAFVWGHCWDYHRVTVKWCPACDFRNDAISW
jgi:hypothetical protein